MAKRPLALPLYSLLHLDARHLQLGLVLQHHRAMGQLRAKAKPDAFPLREHLLAMAHRGRLPRGHWHPGRHPLVPQGLERDQRGLQQACCSGPTGG